MAFFTVYCMSFFFGEEKGERNEKLWIFKVPQFENTWMGIFSKLCGGGTLMCVYDFALCLFVNSWLAYYKIIISYCGPPV